MENIEKIFKFATVVGKLKEELRFKSAKNFKGDTVASHTWRLSLLIIVIAKELKLKINVLEAVKISLVHDLAESITGDIDAKIVFENKKIKKQKNLSELNAMRTIKKLLPSEIGIEIFNLWKNYSEQGSIEAKLVYSLDKVEGIWSYLELENSHFNNNDLVATYHMIGYKLFPDLKPVLDYVKGVIKNEYINRKIEWKDDYEKLSKVPNLKA